MTFRKWITFGSAAALLAATSACNDKGGSSSGTRTSPGQSPCDTSATSQGRRADTPSRVRADGGADLNSGTSTTSPSAPAPADSTGTSSGTSGTDTKK